MKDKPDRALCKDPHVGMSDPVMGEAVRSSCYLSAELFSKSEPFAVQKPLQVMPEYLQRAPCKNTASRWDAPYELYLIYYHWALPFSVML